MDDYIKRENAKRAVWGCARDTGIDEAPFEYAEGLLKDVPSEDVVPVRHGWWKNYKDEHTCSVCDYSFCDEWYSNDDVYNYCPNCGAKMDKERRR